VSTCGWRSSSRLGRGRSGLGARAPQRFSLVVFAEPARTRRMRRSSSGRTRVVTSSLHTKLDGRYVLRLAIATRARRRTTYDAPGRCYADDRHDNETTPGYSQEVFGEVMVSPFARATSARSSGGPQVDLRRELKGMTKALVDSRHEVMDRMTSEAEAKGANAIIAMRSTPPRWARTGPRSAPMEQLSR